MALKVSTRETWAATLKDKPGNLAGALERLARGGVNVEFVVARRSPESRNRGVVFVTPISGKKRQAAAKRAGFRPTDALFSVRIEAQDGVGLGARVARALAGQKLNLRGFSGAAIGKRAVLYIALDSRADARRAVRVLKALR
jgi:hypothetical protein